MNDTEIPDKPPVESSPTDPAPEPAPAPVSHQEWEQMKAQVAELAELRDKNLRLMAEMENLRKRLSQEKQEAVKFANEGILFDCLPLVDNFELALGSLDKSDNIQSVKDGIKMVLGQFQQFLKNNGVEAVEAVGKKFDHNLHEAISEEDRAETEEGTVLAQLRRGYTLRGRLLRPANVIVSRAPGADSGSNAPS
ncbi:MAG: nucleotide exchange factor GrpE [Verrucomicrobiae bacterium]|nr:nucleotide exchange factor GrpE [Verrucomicrobiae bacterium]